MAPLTPTQRYVDELTKLAYDELQTARELDVHAAGVPWWRPTRWHLRRMAAGCRARARALADEAMAQ